MPFFPLPHQFPPHPSSPCPNIKNWTRYCSLPFLLHIPRFLSLTTSTHPPTQPPTPLSRGFFLVHHLIGDAALWRDSLSAPVLAPRYWIKLIIWFPHKLWASRARSCATIVCTVLAHPHSVSVSTSATASSSLLSSSGDGSRYYP